MIRSLLVSALIGLSVISSYANSISQTVYPGTMTNLLSFGPNFGSVNIKQFILTATTSTNASVALVDTTTNATSYVLPAYTNRLSYATNWNTTWTNFYGVVQTNPIPIVVLIDVTNNLVPATTNYYRTPITTAVGGNLSVVYQGVNYYFDQGLWVTNTGSGTSLITITY